MGKWVLCASMAKEVYNFSNIMMTFHSLHKTWGENMLISLNFRFQGRLPSTFWVLGRKQKVLLDRTSLPHRVSNYHLHNMKQVSYFLLPLLYCACGYNTQVNKIRVEVGHHKNFHHRKFLWVISSSKRSTNELVYMFYSQTWTMLWLEKIWKFLKNAWFVLQRWKQRLAYATILLL